MSLQRRLMIYLLVCAPLVWAVAVLVSLDRSRSQVNELYDTDLIRLARQVQAMSIPSGRADGRADHAMPPLPGPGAPDSGESDVRDLAVAVWDPDGRVVLADREGFELPYLPGTVGFVDRLVQGRPWRLYYLQTPSGQMVASGQAAYERDELLVSLIASQIVPWLLVLPALLAAMAWAVRRALSPLRELTGDLQTRVGDDLAPVSLSQAPSELQPMLAAMNSLFARIDNLLTRERRFTADAAHELRTPLAILRAQWDVVKRSRDNAERAQAQDRMDAGLARMDRLVNQMLALSRAESASAGLLKQEIAWQPIVEQVMGDCLDLAHRRQIELACEWPDAPRQALPLIGDEHLLTVLLRNLVDNAARYAPAGSTVTLRMGAEQIEVENAGGPLPPEILAGPGQRFSRPPGQEEGGSGLGLSIVQRIAQLHGLELAFDDSDRKTVRAILRFGATDGSGFIST